MTISLMVGNVTQNFLVNVMLWLCTPSPPLFSGTQGVQAKQVTMNKYAKFSQFNNKKKEMYETYIGEACLLKC
jgi:hypothetical protein